MSTKKRSESPNGFSDFAMAERVIDEMTRKARRLAWIKTHLGKKEVKNDEGNSRP